MSTLDDFRKQDGQIDWDAYRQAEINEGKKCYKCGAYIMLSGISFFGRPERIAGPSLCMSCRSLPNKEEITHESFIRCPKCGHSWNPRDNENYEIYEDGDHNVCCPECDHDFEIFTSVTFTFRSPELISEQEEKDEEDEKNKNT